MRLFLACIAVLFAVTASASAFAETVGRPLQCGIPEKAQMEVDPGLDYCDIYARQMAYHQTQQDFRSLIEQRRGNYVIPRNMAYNAYREKITNSRYPQR